MNNLAERAKAVLADIEQEMSREGGGDTLQASFEIIEELLAAQIVDDVALDAPVTLGVVNWQGRLHCAYLNDFRIAGGKPWAGGTTAKEWKTSLREIVRALPSLQLALGLNYLGRPIAPPVILAQTQVPTP